MNAIGYLRVSTDKQAESGLGLDAQREHVTACAGRLNLALTRVCVDAAVSGSLTIEDRPVLLDAVASLRRGDCLLVIEVAVSSLNYDKKTKARLYAALGVREFWVVDANERISWVHTGPRDDGSWSSIVEHGPEEILTTPALPGFSISLADIQD